VTFPKAWADTVARLRVPSGFLLAASFAWLARPSLGSLLWGVPVSFAGLALRAWAAGHLAKNQRLATSGPYAYLRNPLYAGTLLVAAGLVIASMRWELGFLFAAVFGLVYLPVIQNEEQHLRSLFPIEFPIYCRHVELLWPRLRAWSSGNAARFDRMLYFKNEEYNALLGYLVGLAWLIWRAWPR
jgi:protein-S-isoprenylcysteine O-methyltransferase Ste14